VAKSTGGNSPGLLVIGAGVIVAGWVLLGILAGEWNPGAIYIVLSLIVLLSAYNVAGINVGTGTQRVIGYFMGLGRPRDRDRGPTLRRLPRGRLEDPGIYRFRGRVCPHVHGCPDLVRLTDRRRGRKSAKWVS
jgi:hypothetical protein